MVEVGGGEEEGFEVSCGDVVAFGGMGNRCVGGGSATRLRKTVHTWNSRNLDYGLV